jgi:hypothetical protein
VASPKPPDPPDPKHPADPLDDLLRRAVLATDNPALRRLFRGLLRGESASGQTAPKPPTERPAPPKPRRRSAS